MSGLQDDLRHIRYLGRITVPKLIKMTGLSRLFYKNPTIRKEVDDAVQNQTGLVDPRRAIINMAIKGRIELLEQQVRELQRENEELKKRNAKLQKVVDRKGLNFIKICRGEKTGLEACQACFMVVGLK